ncbi:hypothetical protein MM1218R_01540 [Mycobacterium marinum]|uniref:hypothetical protein n=2 Tax=Mycobacterium marinum TaxID=1781 RepID=UPI000E29AA2B|nr:hypothetical protein [Mycobacterium marinum]AXN43488.1 hypothetical protein MM1218R_01540 [Mycobacterium marinum]RFZ11460.1 hypothetical protein DE4381_01048 [Mycobacterium marinum]
MMGNVAVLERMLAAAAPDVYEIATGSDRSGWLSLWCNGQRCAAPDQHVDFRIVRGHDRCAIESSAASWRGQECSNWGLAELGVSRHNGGDPSERHPIELAFPQSIQGVDTVEAKFFLEVTIR